MCEPLPPSSRCSAPKKSYGTCAYDTTQSPHICHNHHTFATITIHLPHKKYQALLQELGTPSLCLNSDAVNNARGSMSLLTTAALKGDVEAVRLVLKYGGKVSGAPAQFGVLTMPLHGAAIAGHTEIVKVSHLQHTATHCSTLQHTAAHCNTLQHTATHCNTLGVWCARRTSRG